MARKIVTKKSINYATDEILRNLVDKLVKKGPKSYSSNHEALGIITEEYYELIGAVHANDDKHVQEELIDVAMACLFAVVSMKEKGEI